jgi:hypothetical protein
MIDLARNPKQIGNVIRRARRRRGWSQTQLGLKAGVWVLCLLPLAFLLVRVWRGDLTANPISFITNWLGDWALRILLVGLALTPVGGCSASPGRCRRAACSGSSPSSTSVSLQRRLAVDHFFDWHQMGTDIAKRRTSRWACRAAVLDPARHHVDLAHDQAHSRAPTWRRLHRPPTPRASWPACTSSGWLKSAHGAVRVRRRPRAAARRPFWYAAHRRMRNWIAQPREIA